MVVVAAAAALLAGGCGGQSNSGSTATGTGGAAEKVTVEWWNISTTEPLKSFWVKKVKEYQDAHPNVTIKNVPIENEAFKAKLTTVTQSGKTPDLFTTWGGGVLKQQIDAGLVKDLSSEAATWIADFTPAALQAYQFDQKTYGIPHDIGMVGFWYNKELFEKAGITTPPATWTEFLDAVKKLKAAGVTPIALAGKEKWPGHYYWAYLAMRIAGLDALKQAAVDDDFTKPDFIAAGQKLKELVDLQPFQKGFLGAGYGTSDGQAAAMGNGKAAMELMGQWAPSVQSDVGKGLGDKLGFFPFPAVEGGKGSISDAFGGGGGYSVGVNAPPAALDFLKFISSKEIHKQEVETGAVLPVLKGEEGVVKDPNLSVVAKQLASATGFQLYLDQAYPPAVGQEVNDSVAALIAGSKTPEQVSQAITETAKSE
ncbi:sugar ABC transporter substrate-binding protein [Sphaerisporangium melleum]|uniref:Sugar ABC transporter substrate-binding protein n=1 Tax=Sphaerisporangium melleum TaxID=321316 RepID=A0A917VJF1_9ACTN|nr:sugar ABC transporter substrate-binding protein [Sphaerisporangium melleum]GII72885.1 sugar ABC transporter substrate-binding protein [Sphaerisporangium melleum]